MLYFVEILFCGVHCILKERFLMLVSLSLLFKIYIILYI